MDSGSSKNGCSSTNIQPHAYSYYDMRPLGDTELSYYLPSRHNGVNDMFIQQVFQAPANLITRERVAIAWAIYRQRHPLLCSTVQMKSYDDVSFCFQHVGSTEEAISEAKTHLTFAMMDYEEILDRCLNGRRILSDNHLSHLIVSSLRSFADEDSAIALSDTRTFAFTVCAPHYVGDGLVMHRTANDLFTLLGGDLTLDGLKALLRVEMAAASANQRRLPRALESQMPVQQSGPMSRAIATVDHLLTQRKLIGGQGFPRRPGRPSYTKSPTISFDVERTKRMLHNCKQHGVSLNSAMFALANVAWARASHGKNAELPVMMYSAINTRPYLSRANTRLNESYWHLSISFFNIVLPAFFPENGSRDHQKNAMFWHRACSVKAQISRIAKSPMFLSRVREMASERARDARKWAALDDGVAPSPGSTTSTLESKPKPVLFQGDADNLSPGKALIGLSLLGDLDKTYKHHVWPRIKLQSVSFGTRRRPGTLIINGHSILGKFWLNLIYDANGFDDVVLQRFWNYLLTGVDEFLCHPGPRMGVL